jgi:deazaflavin-dependent oxidoreductase (nitroreductase family)
MQANIYKENYIMAKVNKQNEKIVTEFRENEGKVGGYFAGRPLLLLTTTGSKSGEEYISPVMYDTDGDRLLVFASKGGAPTNPSWYYNLVANPEVTVEVGTEEFKAKATVVTGEERDRLYERWAEKYPQFAEYQRKVERKIPVIALERV